MSKRLLTLLTVPLVLVACSKTTAAPTTTMATTSTSPLTPQLPLVTGPLDTSAMAAPTNAKYACEYLTAAAGQLSSNDQSVDRAVTFATSGVTSALNASAHDPAYNKLRTDAEALLEDVVRFNVELQLDGRAVVASKYPASYRKSVKAVHADCS